MRISRAQAFMATARVWAGRSTCLRLNVGAVIVHENNIISLGYNGVPSGEPHCAGDSCLGRLRCDITIHAEANAIDRAVSHITLNGCDLYVTHSPCEACCRLIARHLISRVFFETPYRETSHLEKTYPFSIYQVGPAGYVTNYLTGKVYDPE